MLVPALSACGSDSNGRLLETPVEMPDQWRSDGVHSAPVEDGWLRALDMPALMPLVAEALEANLDLRVTAARLEQARRQAGIEHGARYPTIDLSLNVQRDRSHQETEAGGVDAVYLNERTFVLNVAWELDVWGALQARSEAAYADLEAARRDYGAARLSLAAQTAQLLIDVSTARMQHDLARTRVRSFEDTVERVRRRYERGLATAFDLHLAASDLRTAEGEFAERADQLAKVTRGFEVLLGRYPANLVEGLSNLPALRKAVPAGLPAALLERRPDLAAERKRLLAAGYRVAAARAALLPRISLTASVGTRDEQFKNLFDLDYLIANIAANLVQPIFQGGRLRSQVRLNEAAQEEALAAYA
ncbi:MAG: efflux transporter outer membrane subunit, partial [Geminicoccaceae bacterium]